MSEINKRITVLEENITKMELELANKKEIKARPGEDTKWNRQDVKEQVLENFDTHERQMNEMIDYKWKKIMQKKINEFLNLVNDWKYKEKHEESDSSE